MAFLDAPSRSFYAKLSERVLWTAVQAALGILSASALGIPQVWAVPFASVLAVVKGYVARRVGDPSDPSTLPAGV